VYDEEIAPLMAQIIAICKEHRIPLVAQFNYAATDEDGPSFCTTIIPASAVALRLAPCAAIGHRRLGRPLTPG
jgi:hypothetical protein